MTLQADQPLLKVGHRLPIQFMKNCRTCGEYTLYINFTKDFYSQCHNPYCKDNKLKDYFRCIVRKRNHEVTRATLRADDGLVLNESFSDLDLNSLNSKEKNFTEEDGPYSPCPGIVSFDPDLGIKLHTHLVCSHCKSAYETVILATDGLFVREDHHRTHRVVNINGQIKLVTSWPANDIRYTEIPPQVLFVVLKVITSYGEIRELEKWLE